VEPPGIEPVSGCWSLSRTGTSANGELLKVNEDNPPRVVLGAKEFRGNNFGIVTSRTFQAYRIPELIQGFIRWDWQHFADFADAFQRPLPTLDNKINTIAHLERKDLGCRVRRRDEEASRQRRNLLQPVNVIPERD
jgi:hypothetical protein